MLNTYLYIFWLFFYILCAALGVLGLPGWVGITACVLFFLPPTALLIRLDRAGDRKGIARIRNISLLWLCVTVLLLILNIATVYMSATAGAVFYYLLAVLCAPLVCGEYWILSLFLFSCLLMGSIRLLRKHK